MSLRHFLFPVLVLLPVIGIAACSGDDDDDDSPVSDAGQHDSSTSDATTQPQQDASSESDASDSGPSCYTCGRVFQEGINGELCEGTIDLILAVNNCACDPSNCASDCSEECANSSVPGDVCLSCTQTKCADQIAACISDDGTYRPDAGSDAGEEPDDASADDASTDADTDAAPIN